MDSDTPDVGRSVPRYYEDSVDEGANLYDVVFNPMPTLAEMDEQELVKASQEEDKSQRSVMAEALMKAASGQEYSLPYRMARVLRAMPLGPPEVEVVYRGLTIEADAMVGESGNPSLWNSFAAGLRWVTFRGKAETRRLTILRDVDGVLSPGRYTLLLGPPGSGKSLFLKALGGRLDKSSTLTIGGEVLYNGVRTTDFVVPRVGGMIEQYDHHIPNLNVLETMEFAYKCSTGKEAVHVWGRELDALLQHVRREVASRAAQDKGLDNLESGLGQGEMVSRGGRENGASRPASAASGATAYQDAQSRPGSSLAPSASASSLYGADGAQGASPGEAPAPLAAPLSSAHPSLSGRPESLAPLGSPETSNVLKTPGPRTGDVDAPWTAEDVVFLERLVASAEARIKPHVIMNVLGLAHAAATPVGDAMTRGVSGGERKRVTTGEILVGTQRVLLCDEISTGLDSATTYSVAKYLRDACHAMRRTVLVLLLQPPPEVMTLFDDVLLLTDGRVLYHGAVAQVLPFFASLGFACPPRKDPGSFLQEVTTPVGQLTYATPALLAQRGVPLAAREPARMAARPPKRLVLPVEAVAQAFWESSAEGAALLARARGVQVHSLEAGDAEWDWGKAVAATKAGGSGGGGTPGARSARPWAPKNQYALPWLDLTKIVLKRQVVLNIVRSSRFFTARLVQTIIIALIIGSLFWNISVTPDTWRSSIAVCVLTTIFLAMMSTPHISLVFSTKRVFFKHRDAKFFSASSYVAGLVLTQVPSSTIESIAFAVIVYFMVNFYRSAGAFFIYLLVAWSASNCLAGLFRLVAYFVPTMVAANAGAGMTILLFMITNGFSIVRPDIPPYIVWIYYINPLAWAIRALAINELGSPQWAVPVSPGSSQTIGDVALDAFGLGSNRAFIWGAVGIQWGMLVLYSLLGVLALKYTNPPPPRASVSPEDARLSVEAGVLSQSGRQDNLSRRAMSQLSSMFFLGSGRGREGGEKGGARDESLGGAPDPAGVPLAATYEEGALSGVTERTVLPFTQISLVCRDIRYYVPDPSKGMAPGVVKGSDDPAIEGKLQLLKGVSLHAVPGDLLALMGGSGAGKTTLMDVVAGRKTIGLIRGDIFVNGHPKQQASWSRVMGYVEQTDIHTAAVTVRESLLFSARLRLGREHGMKTVGAVVDETLELVELSSRQQSIVGEPGGVGLSLEQRKRLSIAVELVANPSVVFMDEPTSGLDARAAAIVMRAVRNVADSRRTVMVTIHQPSLELFEAFDSLILLQRGGRVTYFGPLGAESASLLGYLQAVPGVEPCRPGYNPATWMLEVTGGSMSTTFAAAEHDFPQLYADSRLRKDNDVAAEAVRARAEKEHEPLSVGTQFAASYGTQVYWLTRKFFKVYWHLPSYNMVRLGLTLIIALIYGVTYLHKGDLDYVAGGQPLTVAAVQNIAGLSFSMVMFLGMFNCMTVQPVVYAERIVFYRERAASMYSPGPYSFATTVVELPYLLTQTVIMIGIAYFMVGLEIAWTPLVLWFVGFGLTLQMFTGFGVLCVYATPHILVAMLLTSGINQLWTFFNGFLIPFDQIPHGWKWMNRISPTTWVLYGLVGSQLSNRDNPMVGLDGNVTTVGAFVTSYFGYEYSFIWWCVLIIFAYALAFRVMSVLFLKYVNFQRR